MNLAIDQETTEKLVNEFLEDQKNIIIKLSNGVTRYLNTKNILYIDTVEIIEKEGEKINMKSFELVLIGHPDKVCDRVSQVICNHNKNGRNAIECCWGNKLFTVNGETDLKWTKAKLEKVVKSVLDKEIGLVKEELDSITVVNNLNVQSSEINNIVGDLGTGDNGIYFGGYHRVYSPVIRKMKDLCLALTAKKLSGWGYRSDGKFIFTVDKTGEIVEFVINVASFSGVELKTDKLINFIKTFVGDLTEISVNPKGNWNNCFAFADSGLTGRKLGL